MTSAEKIAQYFENCKAVDYTPFLCHVSNAQGYPMPKTWKSALDLLRPTEKEVDFYATGDMLVGDGNPWWNVFDTNARMWAAALVLAIMEDM